MKANERLTDQVGDRSPGSRQSSLAARLAPLGGNMSREAIVTGSSAMNAAFGAPLRGSHSLDLVVPEAAYRYLREQPGWSEVRFAGEYRMLRHGDLEVSIKRGHEPGHRELASRAWRTPEGIQVAGLADVYAFKQARRLPKDVTDIALIRARLLDPNQPPLTGHVLQREIQAVRSFLPDTALNHPDAGVAVRLAAHGKYITSTLHGDPGVGQVNQIIGDLELPEYRVPATYHNGFGLAEDGRLLQQHLGNIGASPHERLDAAAADTYSDAVYGNGRRSNNPDGYDELRSADLAHAHALSLGYEPARADRIHEMIKGTAFDEQTKAQAGKHHPDPLVQSIAGVDLQTLAQPSSLEDVLDLVPEDLTSRRYSPDRVLGRTLDENNLQIRSTAEALAITDDYAEYRPSIDGAPSTKTVMDAFAYRFTGNAGFSANHQYPPAWTLDNPELRAEHAEKTRELGQKLADRDITATQAHQEARYHTEAMQEKYGR
ncbi:hypothetical protein ABZW96_37360 [Nocardia sp. NPDC004168]|uniref:hypothetical protein n=1 Tax=Nocardia sp. NPDC004168 TaxID=3154452 RepID=UPI0033BAD89A